MAKTPDRPLIRLGEYASYAAGIAFTGFFLVQIAQGEVDRRSGIKEFQQLASLDVPASPPESVAPPPLEFVGEPDMAQWAPGRIEDYYASLQADLPPVLGVLELPAVGLSVPVYSTDSELAMDRGAGVIDGMAYPHEPGNIGIAGHRDGYFRALKDVRIGDTLKLQTFDGLKQFTINSVQVVEIADTHVLQDTDDQTVTLVTCYPFYFVGHAPQRYIVTASLDTPNVNQQ